MKCKGEERIRGQGDLGCVEDGEGRGIRSNCIGVIEYLRIDSLMGVSGTDNVDTLFDLCQRICLLVESVQAKRKHEWIIWVYDIFQHYLNFISGTDDSRSSNVNLYHICIILV